jgi:hypothetical protein
MSNLPDDVFHGRSPEEWLGDRNEGAQRETGAWLEDYVLYAHAASPLTPMNFHRANAIWAVWVVIGRRLRADLPWAASVFPNLFFAQIAPSTAFAKTTGLKVARQLITDVMPRCCFLRRAHPKPCSPYSRAVNQRASRTLRSGSRSGGPWDATLLHSQPNRTRRV